MRNIYIMSGLPGSGKSTYVDAHARIGDYVLHRDDYRAELRRQYDTDQYFPVSAKQEYDGWVKRITDCMEKSPGADIWIDQTTLTQAALNKLVNAIKHAVDETNDQIVILQVDTPLGVCLERNAEREGYACVPDTVIRDMYNSMVKDPIQQARCEAFYPTIAFCVHSAY